DNGLQVIVIFVDRELDTFPIGKTAASPVEAHERVMLRQFRKPRTPNKAVPVGFEVMQPVLYPDQQRTRSADRVGDTSAIATGAKADLLRRGKHYRASMNAWHKCSVFSTGGRGRPPGQSAAGRRALTAHMTGDGMRRSGLSSKSMSRANSASLMRRAAI